MSETAPLRILIAAMGGEGGGVLAGWLTRAALSCGLFVQRTSVPGVAQRTGATTYYLEMLEGRGPGRPVLALNPVPGRVDLLIASELLETARMIQAGYVTAGRTHVVASTHRVYTVDEKSAMADGRLPPDRLEAMLHEFARSRTVADFAAIARGKGCHLNAVLLGAVAGSHLLPITVDAFRAAIEADGKAVAANLRGFDAGLALCAAPGSAGSAAPAAAEPPAPDEASPPVLPDELARRIDSLAPPAARAMVTLGAARVLDYQDAAYARLYLDRLARLADRPDAAPELVAALARHLALRMSFDDTIRVAERKLRAARLAALRAEARAGPGDIVDVVEYLKPGPEELCSLLPARFGARALALVRRRGWSGRAVSLQIRTTRFSGFLRLRFLAALRGWRPRSLRFAEEQAWIEDWLALIEAAHERDPRLAGEVIEAAGLLKGYSATYKHGQSSFAAIADAVIRPGLAARWSPDLMADAVLQARLAALADPKGEALARTLEEIGRAIAGRSIAAE